MNFHAFNESLSQAEPPKQLSVPLISLWYDGKGDWEKAHDLINDRTDRISAHIHAYLHRKEGDQGNARYWYRLANQKVYTGSLEEEWEALVTTYLTTAP